MPVKLSPSRLGLFDDCPRCFWFHQKAGLDRPSGPFPSLPSGVDRAIKAHFDRHRARGKLPAEIDGLVDERLHPDQSFLDDVRDWRREPKLRDHRLDVVLRGGVDDLLVSDDGSLVVLDYKTRGFPPRGDGAPEYYTRQLNCYYLLLRETGHPTAAHAYLLYYHPDAVLRGGVLAFHTDLVSVPVDVAAARRLLKDAAAAIDGPLPDAAADCEYCQWASTRARF